MSRADYSVWIDWDNDGGLNLSDFETTVDQWYSSGTTPPAFAVDHVQYHGGSNSLLVTWQGYVPFQFDISGHGFDKGKFALSGFENVPPSFMFDTAGSGFDQGRFGVNNLGDPSVQSPKVLRNLTGLIVGRQYNISIWTYTPSSGGRSVYFGVKDIYNTSPSTTVDAWQNFQFSFVATSTTHIVQVSPNGDPADGDKTWIDQLTIWNDDEDVTDRTLSGGSDNITFSTGRQVSRSLSPITSSDTSFSLQNQDYLFTPDNPATPLGPYLGPGKPVLIRASFQNVDYNLFRGFLSDFQLLPDWSNQNAAMSATDLLGNMSNITLSTALYGGLRSGDAINKVLDEIGWSTDLRDVDPGCSVIRWWWEEGTDALSAISKIVNSEGIPAIAYIDPNGTFVFRGRKHRLLYSRSTSVQRTYHSTDTEPEFSMPFTYDIGWQDMFNHIDLDVDDRYPDHTDSEIYSTEETISILPREQKIITISGSDPFIYAKCPVQGLDYILASGSVTFQLSRKSGASTILTITAGASGAILTGLVVRAIMVPVQNTVKITVDDDYSIQKHGLMSYVADSNGDIPWASMNDMVGITAIMLGQRSERLPTVSITVNNDNDTRLNALLQTRLSDRLHIVEPNTFTDHDYFVEQLSHTISDAGTSHTALFGCERVRDQVANVFTFDDVTRGFDSGYFGYSGIDSPSTMFILDSSHLDTGLLGF
jgi:hypothetical protein